MDNFNSKDTALIKVLSHQSILLGLMNDIAAEIGSVDAEEKNYLSIISDNGSKDHVTMENRRCRMQVDSLRSRKLKLQQQFDTLEFLKVLLDEKLDSLPGKEVSV